ncbi:hypothetical protein A3K34_00825 [candidate division WWE3 bacterium RIFOXYC1_FULL_40_10]|uniref:Phosphoribosyltransferase domain-containing protein n=1 Tax=candidate division WWE3 bacterium RIFOXYA2_FULL_46_9 TaxID=1802636 RepID=A0A1F4W1T1_UNCKA|nr:MAG: hypothetical protein A3K58_00825 [candidate division WWE3 bacterium RIFOXYB1_FULL_40_22]OGC61418.1 MAG: hypothetical protein A3K37_00825 [candidate division WWE3 bacterium RIFOXYA1_FULL_40_11]OGC63351.1 MAG: hypothetical protein A2264_01300 [candidate division WWE3 bacterium RIFOXYA2_FULL_46_9]OGC65443.1 MAG: hypothetical protein A2326_00165 [candidate division WWE3 bacterium RIFOXYB2_FULL_41_6]OGC65801.1 MAG: hypothetical protein A3K34_00825 [candidate division WWE3 bacterium RIFOXYC1_
MISEAISQITAERDAPELYLAHDNIELIEREMKKNYGKWWGFHDDSFNRGSQEINESEYMLPGTIRLINKTLNEFKHGDPYDTLIFLDKSGRPGAYLYRQLVEQLTTRQLLPEGFVPPKVRFMDLGKTDDPWKIRNPETASMMTKMLQISPDEKVLIVDEFKDTGATLNGALAELNKIYGTNPEGTYQFENSHGPFWYRDPEQKLVVDARVFKRTKEFIEELNNSDLKESLAFLAKQLQREEFNKLIEIRMLDIEMSKATTEESLLKELAAEYNNNGGELIFPYNVTRLNPEELRHHLSILAHNNELLDPDSIYNYYHYAGGRFAAPRTGDRKKGLGLYEMMKRMAVLTADMIEQKS